MIRLKVIGIGPGGIDQVTMAAVRAMNEVDVFLVPDKGTLTQDQVTVRRELCERWIDGDYEFVEVRDPRRDRNPDQDAAAYTGAVLDWHAERVRLYRDLLIEREQQTIGLLSWGDPTLYDSTLRIVEGLRGTGLQIDLELIPGISSVQLLTCAHQVTLNRIGRPVLVTTGRRLVEDWAPGLDVVVMLDGHLSCSDLVGHGLEICWGAYLGLPEQRLIRGPLDQVIPELLSVRTELRAKHGWIMDTYLLRQL